jgi:hypothetical protein
VLTLAVRLFISWLSVSANAEHDQLEDVEVWEGKCT